MKCPKCIEQGKKSKVFGGDYGMKTLAYYAPYYDEEGKHHNHDGNTTTSNYTCSNNHSWTEKSSGSCWCGWTGGKTKIIMNDDITPPTVIKMMGGYSGFVTADSLTFDDNRILKSEENKE